MTDAVEDWGWDGRWAAAFEAAAPGGGLLPARVVHEHRGAYGTVCADGERVARLPGALRRAAADAAALPAVGDWVALEPLPGERTAMVRALLPRRTKLSRRASGENELEQVVAANLDAVFVTTSLGRDFNPRRLERFLAACRESGAEPVLLLNKLDACADPAPLLAEARSVAGDAAVVALSARTGAGIEALADWVRPGRTVGFVGSSGVGKSTLINRLLGREALRTGPVREHDERGRHTTTRRELFLLPGGGVLLDTPGMREMQLWEAGAGLGAAFDEIEALASSCRFGDCRHEAEPGCAVKAAAESGAVAAERLESWRKLRRELEARARAEDPALKAAAKRRAREMGRALKKHPRYKR